MSKPFRIGVISDSHVPHRIPALPQDVFDWLAGSDLILHAGDVEDPRMLDSLRRIAPVHAVKGNVHWQTATGITDQDLPLSLTLPVTAHGRTVTIWMTHGHLNFRYLFADKFLMTSRTDVIQMINDRIIARLRRQRPVQAEIVVFGHSHKPLAETHDGVLFFNPGAVVGAADLNIPPSMGALLLHADGHIEPRFAPVPSLAATNGR